MNVKMRKQSVTKIKCAVAKWSLQLDSGKIDDASTATDITSENADLRNPETIQEGVSHASHAKATQNATKRCRIQLTKLNLMSSNNRWKRKSFNVGNSWYIANQFSKQKAQAHSAGVYRFGYLPTVAKGYEPYIDSLVD